MYRHSTVSFIKEIDVYLQAQYCSFIKEIDVYVQAQYC